MDKTISHPEESEEDTQQNHQWLTLCLPLFKPKTSNNSNPFTVFTFWVSKSLRNFCYRAKISDGCFFRRFQFTGIVVNNSVNCGSPCLIQAKMEGLVEKSEEMDEKKDGFGLRGYEIGGFGDGVEDGCKESSSCSDFLASEVTMNEEHSSSEDSSSSPPSMFWSIEKNEVTHCTSSDVSQEMEQPHLNDRKLDKQGSSISEVEMMKERFSKLLLGEDMSGCGNGVSTALAISNAVTNLCATLFGQIWRLEPLPPEKKSMWRREMEWLLCVSDYIVELIPCWQTFPDGSKLEVMTCRPRSDLYINLPALRKLDNMLLEILDGFDNSDFWYVDQGILAPESDGSSLRKPLPRQEEKWWLPVPRVPTGGLSEKARKQLQHKRDCTNQILKASMAINSITLAEMEVPESYLEALPKNGRASLGDLIHRYIISDQFSPEFLLDCLDLSSEYQVVDIANRVEASIYVWRRRNNSKPVNSTNRSNSKSSWEMVKELVIDADNRELLAERAESLLLCLKQRFPGLPQTTLDMSKIQHNKDVGKSILESYSRVLESLAFNIMARIDDLLHVDDLTKHSDKFLSISKVGAIAHKNVGIQYSLPVSSTPYKTAFTSPSFSPSHLVSPTKGERSPFPDGSMLPYRGFGVKKVLTDYLSIDTKGKHYGNQVESSDSFSNRIGEESASQTRVVESFECSKAASSPLADAQLGKNETQEVALNQLSEV